MSLRTIALSFSGKTPYSGYGYGSSTLSRAIMKRDVKKESEKIFKGLKKAGLLLQNVSYNNDSVLLTVNKEYWDDALKELIRNKKKYKEVIKKFTNCYNK